MKRRNSFFFTRTVFLLVLLFFFTGSRQLVFTEKAAPRVLARVDVPEKLADLPLPVYAHLQDASGQDYALVIAPEAQFARAGVSYGVLDKNAGGADYFIINTFYKDKRRKAFQMAHVLHDDGEQMIIRSTFQKVEALARSGFNVQRLDHTPMVLRTPPRQEDASIMAVTYDATIDQMMDQVSQAAVQTYTENLSGENQVTIGGSGYTITTRHTDSGTPIDKATQYVYEFMQGLGLSVSYHDWTASFYSGRNVIGELPGTTQADEIVLVTAHLDCMPSGSTAPGADDNASGSVGVMLCAEMLSQHQFKRTVRFVFFTGEEQGLLGSDKYSDLVYQAGDNITAVYNMDMLSYDAVGGPDLRLHTRISTNPGYPGDLAIANTFIDVVNAYGMSGNLNPIIDADGITQSDHSSFWNNGYSAILGIEEHDSDMTPYYHTTSDMSSTLNYTYFTNFVKASVGTAAHLAMIDDGTIIADFSGSPTSGGSPLTVDFTDLSVGATSWSWDFGDSGTATVQNPSHTYTAPGSYTVTLTATNASGSDSETKTGYITVTAPQPPVADFSASTTNPTAGGSVSFTDLSTNNPTSWSWTFAGGTPGTSTAQNPTITYNTEGTYDVTLTATNAQGQDTETKVGYIAVSALPYCDSRGSDYSYEWISRVQVAGMDNSSGAAGYTDFTGITCDLTAGNNVNVTLNPGFSGSSYTEYWKIWIDYNGDHDFADAGEEVFSGSGSSSVSGNFTVPAGLNIVTRMRVSMKYSSAPTSCGSFTYGEVEDYTVDISPAVPQPPVAAFTASATTVTVGGSVNFIDQSSNNPTSWSWSFEGGTPSGSTAQNPTVTYNTEGTYNVTLTAANASGSDDEVKIDYITVTAAPADEIAEGVDNGALSFTKSGNADWFKDTSVYYYDGDSACSGDIGNNQSTTIETNVTVGATQAVKFFWKVSSEANYDYLRFYIDGVQQDAIAGTVDWTQKAFNIGAGTHTLKWSFTKDVSVSSGSDCGWVDKLEITDPAADPIAEAVDAPSLSFTLSGDELWYVTTGDSVYGGSSVTVPAALGHSEQATMETTISGVTQVKFYWKVSSEANYDYLKFYIDGVLQDQVSGSTSWAQKTYPVSAGSHTLKWVYDKDGSVSSGSDCGWVDKVEIQ